MFMTAKTLSTPNKTKLQRFMPWLLVVVGVIGLVCSFIIMVEKIHIYQNGDYTTVCDINPVISCGSIMRTEQSNAFGFPNPIIGLVAFPVLITIGMAMFAGATFKRWFWIGLQLGTIFGIGFVHWLFYQSVWSIGALCPFCMVVWTVTIAMFWYTLLYNLREGHIKVPASWGKFTAFLQRHHLDILITWYVVITALILHHFWYYFGASF